MRLPFTYPMSTSSTPRAASPLALADKNRNSRMLLGDTIRMLRRLGVNVIQEGVETKYQLDFVLEAGANLIQGFYFSQPLRPDAFVDYVERFKGVKTEKTK